MSHKPLLGWNKPYSLSEVRYPCFASYKLDGWRAWPLHVEFMSRNFKTIANRDLQRRFKEVLLQCPNWDGELIAGDPEDPLVYSRTDSILKSHEKDASSVRWFVFDDFSQYDAPYHARLARLRDLQPLVIVLDQVECRNPDDVLELEQKALERNYEGLCLRSPTGRYKCGRSTLREQYLLKLKRFLDGEGRVTGFNEAMHNANEATTSPLGYSVRSSHQANQVPMGTLGSLTVEMGGVEFRVGTGFSAADRAEIWRNRDKYLGKLCTIKYSPILKDKPRQPRFKGWRGDLS